jgi:hypothetical protein
VAEPAPRGLEGGLVARIGSLKVGDRVQVPAWHDDWMRGDRYGSVVHVAQTKDTVRVLYDKSSRVRRWNVDFLTKVT